MDRGALNILHISDLHLRSSLWSDQKIVVDAFFSDLKATCDTPNRPSLIVFTGDLVYEGDDNSAYTLALDKIIVPLLEITGVSPDHLILVPGNHDARRSIITDAKVDHDRAVHLSSRDELNEFYKQNAQSDLFIDKFHNFFALQEMMGNKNVVGRNSLFCAYHLPDYDVAIAALNSAWLTQGGLSPHEKGVLAIPELAVDEAFSCLPASRVRLLLTHHPLSWFTDENASDLKRAIPGDYIHLFGHVHEPEPEQHSSPVAACLSCQSGALFTRRQFYNGYSILSLSPDREHARVMYRSYFDKRRRFDIANDILPSGLFYPSPVSEQYWSKQPVRIPATVVEGWITTDVAAALKPLLEDGLTNRPIHEIFVPPPLLLTSDFCETPDVLGPARPKELGWVEFVTSNENHMVRGRPEFGKTAVLRQLAHELVATAKSANRPRVPILVAFAEVAETVGKFTALLRTSVPEMPSGMTFSNMANDGYLCLLVDDVNFAAPKKVAVLSEFMKAHPRCRYVLTTTFDTLEMIGRIRSAEFPVSVTNIYLEQFGRGRLRQIVQRFGIGDEAQQELLLNRIMSDLHSMNVPITAVNGTILLNIFQSDRTFVPVNRAIVMQRFVDLVLKRSDPDETRRSTFDSKNKTHLLGKIARWMCEAEIYEAEYSKVYDLVQAYLTALKLPYDAGKIISELINCKIFAERGTIIRFRYASFFYFFVACEMMENDQFRKWVFDGSRYLMYLFEIEYYSGLHRADSDALVLIRDRFRDLSNEIRKELGETGDLSLIDKITPPQGRKGEDGYSLIHRQLKLPPATKMERDELLEGEAPSFVEARQTIRRFQFTNNGSRWVAGLMLLSRVLRNMELVDGGLKVEAAHDVFFGWGEFLVRLLQAIPNLVRHRKIILDGVLYEILAPPNASDEKLTRFLVMNMPRTITTTLLENLGSEKLRSVLEETSRNEANIEKFYRELLYADLRLPNFIPKLSALLKDIGKSPYLLEALVWKMHYSYRRTLLSPTEDESLRRVFAQARVMGAGERGPQATKREAEEMQRLEKLRLIQLLHHEDE